MTQKMKRQEKMDPGQRDAYQTLLKELENLGEEAAPTRRTDEPPHRGERKSGKANGGSCPGIAGDSVWTCDGLVSRSD